MTTIIAPVQLDCSVEEFVSQLRKLLIGGEWVNAQSGRTFETYNPATGEVLAQVAEGDTADIDLAVAAARKAFETGPWPEMSHAQRGHLLWKLSDLIAAHLEEFAELETLDNGKPLFFSRIVDVPTAVEVFSLHGWLGNKDRRHHGPTIRAHGKVPRVHAARAGWRCGSDYPLEFPPHHGFLETSSRAGSGMHMRA
jgi:phenylacetaldehyde dehydrogenase